MKLTTGDFYFAHCGGVEAGYLDTLRSESINADTLRLFNMEIFTKFDLRSRLSNATAPTLVITGDGDSGHMVFIEQPQAFHDEAGDFLGS